MRLRPVDHVTGAFGEQWNIEAKFSRTRVEPLFLGREQIGQQRREVRIV